MKQTDNSPQKPSKTYLSTKDFLVSGEKFDLVLEEDLGLLRTQPQPAPTMASKYYDSKAYISHTDSKRGLINFLYQVVKNYNLKRKTRLVTTINQGTGALLDLGAGTGDFLVTAKRKGWVVTGVEINSRARMKAELKGITLLEDLKDLEKRQYDVITLWHVLEHLYDLDVQIQRLLGLLNPGGSLIIAVPNYRSYDAHYYGPYWAGYDVPRHLWHFSQESMRKLFSPYLQLENVFPMIFDAYYVSLLSEKYKSGKRFSLKAIWVGLKSNWLARQSTEYSSLIYCFRKPTKSI